ncbi:alpha carbonic anhydrase 1 chloroplastic [Phtheirospermum japonicum]|uniref:Carbonic anhydrase n=1 Tax=Phtheirospermum japonicum TaxID=374723 RepID=A0A830CP04_9LAMI|nr:alpha carbonic anhydrase 1 chloroplastic [Phtheirospermum japonicum]
MPVNNPGFHEEDWGLESSGGDPLQPSLVDKPLQFTYSGATGPTQWASLSPSFELCATGKSQSPIDIVTKQAIPSKTLKPLIRKYNAVNVTLVNNKFTVAIEYPDHTGEIIVDDKHYPLKQMHWHSPSEHRINGKRFAAELHMVHVSEDGNVLAVATLFKYGKPDPLLGEIHDKMKELVRNEEAGPIKIRHFHPAELRRTSTKYYRYIGSSSVPPCSENLMYLVLAKARTISREQVEALKAPLDMGCKYNARPCQPINGRRVEVYED